MLPNLFNCLCLTFLQDFLRQSQNWARYMLPMLCRNVRLLLSLLLGSFFWIRQPSLVKRLRWREELKQSLKVYFLCLMLILATHSHFLLISVATFCRFGSHGRRTGRVLKNEPKPIPKTVKPKCISPEHFSCVENKHSILMNKLDLESSVLSSDFRYILCILLISLWKPYFFSHWIKTISSGVRLMFKILSG